MQDMETQLLVKSIDGDAVTIPGYFRPAQRTLAGCQCSQSWIYAGTNETVYGTCINPAGDPKGAWCNYEPDSCTNKTGELLLPTALSMASLFRGVKQCS
jgi:hypothetical protein